MNEYVSKLDKMVEVMFPAVGVKCLIRMVDLPIEMDHPVEVRDSGIHGKGLFATRFIPKGKAVTLYPMHAVINRNEPAPGPPGSFFTYGDQMPDMKMYRFDVGHRKLAYVGNPNKQVAGYLCHFMNDGYPHTDRLKDGSFEEVWRYLHAEQKCNNCVYTKGSYLVSITTMKDVQPGEELTVAYSPFYWIQSNRTPEEIIEGYTSKQKSRMVHFYQQRTRLETIQQPNR